MQKKDPMTSETGKAAPALFHGASVVMLKPGERIDDLQRGGCRIIQREDLFCFGMDAVLLAAFAKVKRTDRVLDLCSGNGVIPILMDARIVPGCGEGEVRPQFTGVEINPVCVDMARRSVLMNGQQERVRFLEEDIRNVCTAGAKTVLEPACAPSSFDAVTANPPYMTGGAGLTGENRDLTIARHEVLCNIGDVAAAASRALRFGGHLYLVHRPHRLMDICRACGANGLEVKRLRMVHPFAEKEANMVLIDAVKGGRSYVHAEAPLIIYREKGVYTQEVREIYG